jgi:hypothetical protein
LHTLGFPELRRGDGTAVLLTDQAIALVVLLRLLKRESGHSKKRYLEAIGKKISAESTNPAAMIHKYLADIRKQLQPSSVDWGKSIDWIQALPCDAELLLQAREPTPHLYDLLLRYRPFLEGFNAGPNAQGFQRFAAATAEAVQQAFRNAWSMLAQDAAEKHEWDKLFAISRAGLGVDRTWEDAYLELYKASCRTAPPKLLYAINRGETLLAELKSQKKTPRAEVLIAIDDARNLYSQAEPGQEIRPAGGFNSRGELIEAFVHPVATGSVGWEAPAVKTAEPFDVFLASPMDGLGEEYEDQRNSILDVVRLLRQIPGRDRVYYAGENLPTREDYDDEGIALRDCLRNLRAARFFLLIYPRRVASSVILEAGFALMLAKPGVIFYRRREDLPFLLRDVRSEFPAMHTCKYSSFDNLLTLIHDQVSSRLLPRSQASH